MRLVLAGAESDGRDAVTHHPVGIESAARDADVRRPAVRRHRRGGALHHGERVLHAERKVVGARAELDAPALAVAVLHGLRRLLERGLVGPGDVLEEFLKLTFDNNSLRKASYLSFNALL